MIEHVEALDRGALFSPCRRWRYLLWRRWDPNLAPCLFVCLNPSTADETEDDPTIRRCVRFAKDWGYGSLWVANLFAFRATDPKAMIAAGQNAIGPRNNEYLMQAALQAGLVVFAWGNWGRMGHRQRDVTEMMLGAAIRPHCLGMTGASCPKHPLYLRADTQPMPCINAPLLRVGDSDLLRLSDG